MRHTVIKTATHTAAIIVLSLVSSVALAESGVEKCSNNLGTISVVEAPQGYGYLSAYGLGSPSALLRMMIQQSGCFDVVERGGAAFSSIQQERALAGGGDLQEGSNLGKGQLQAADFVLTPNIQVSAGDTGGIGGMLGGLGGMFGKVGGIISSVAGGVKFKEAETNILVADVRSGIQVASAEGKAKKTDFNISAWGYGSGNYGSAGGYTKTPEGKMIAASLLDNYNNIVIQVRDKTQLIKSRSTSSAANANASIQATNQPRTTQQYAPAPVAAQAPAPAKAGAARYAGSFSGSDQGSFAVSIAADGNISGSGNSAAGRFTVTGFADQSGNVSMTTAGSGGGASFSGFVDSATGALKGVWTGKNAAQGAFTGNKM
jgi:hypothetical protein